MDEHLNENLSLREKDILFTDMTDLIYHFRPHHNIQHIIIAAHQLPAPFHKDLATPQGSSFLQPIILFLREYV
jgi:hypothetical protein